MPCHFTYMHSHSAGLRADVGAGECKWFSAHLTEVSHEGMIRDTDAHELESTRTSHQSLN